MANKKIKDLPLLTIIDGTEILPTGGKGDYALTVDQLKSFIRTKQEHQKITVDAPYIRDLINIDLGDFYSTEVIINSLAEVSNSDYSLNGDLIKINGGENGGEQFFTVKTSTNLNIDTTDGLTVFENTPKSGTINKANVRYFSEKNGYQDCTISYSVGSATSSDTLSFVLNKNTGDSNQVIFYFYEDSEFKTIKNLEKTLNLSDGVEVCFSTILNSNSSPLSYVNVDLNVLKSDEDDEGNVTVTITNNSTENPLYFEINLNQDTTQEDYIKFLSGSANTTIEADSDNQIIGCLLGAKTN